MSFMPIDSVYGPEASKARDAAQEITDRHWRKKGEINPAPIDPAGFPNNPCAEINLGASPFPPKFFCRDTLPELKRLQIVDARRSARRIETPITHVLTVSIEVDAANARAEIDKLRAAIDEALSRTKPVVRTQSARPGGLVGKADKSADAFVAQIEARLRAAAEEAARDAKVERKMAQEQETALQFKREIAANEEAQRKIGRAMAYAGGGPMTLREMIERENAKRHNPMNAFMDGWLAKIEAAPRPGWTLQIPYDLADWLYDQRCTGLQYRDGCCVLTSESGKTYVIEGAFQSVTWSNDVLINLACTPVVALRPATAALVKATRQWIENRERAGVIRNNIKGLAS